MTRSLPSARHGRQRDVLADQPLQHRDRFADGGVELQHARLQHLLSAEGQELLGERRGPVRRSLDQLEILAWLRPRLEALEEDLAPAVDDRE